ncbi:hypothetical protein Tco_1081305 [Tanacetum coccineum]|uniref:Uncharacterized protein n=1 Tax=Tanacetum coccineum TaxID=301880 RepID=A0ABQ5HYP9_9ASTR
MYSGMGGTFRYSSNDTAYVRHGGLVYLRHLLRATHHSERDLSTVRVLGIHGSSGSSVASIDVSNSDREFDVDIG